MEHNAAKMNRLYCMRSNCLFITIALIFYGKNKLYIAKLTILYIARRESLFMT